MSKTTVKNLKDNLLNAVGHSNILRIFGNEDAWTKYLQSDLQIDTRMWCAYPEAIKTILQVPDISEFVVVGPLHRGPSDWTPIEPMIMDNLCPRQICAMLLEIGIDRDLANTTACNRDASTFWRLLNEKVVDFDHNIFMSNDLLKNIILLYSCTLPPR